VTDGKFRHQAGLFITHHARHRMFDRDGSTARTDFDIQIPPRRAQHLGTLWDGRSGGRRGRWRLRCGQGWRRLWCRRGQRLLLRRALLFAEERLLGH
jgi:hypothetical protein